MNFTPDQIMKINDTLNAENYAALRCNGGNTDIAALTSYAKVHIALVQNFQAIEFAAPMELYGFLLSKLPEGMFIFDGVTLSGMYSNYTCTTNVCQYINSLPTRGSTAPSNFADTAHAINNLIMVMCGMTENGFGNAADSIGLMLRRVELAKEIHGMLPIKHMQDFLDEFQTFLDGRFEKSKGASINDYYLKSTARAPRREPTTPAEPN